eukprot:1900939-Prymnesium_polylepis.1
MAGVWEVSLLRCVGAIAGMPTKEAKTEEGRALVRGAPPVDSPMDSVLEKRSAGRDSRSCRVASRA